MNDDRAMSKAAQKILDEFDALPEPDRKLVAVEILERAVALKDLSSTDVDELEDLTDEQRTEIGHRLAEHDRDPGTAIPWEEGRDRLFRLDAAERIQLVEDLWDSVAADVEDVPFTDEEWAEIQKRRAEHAQDPTSAIPWEEVRTQLYRRFS